MKLLEQRAPRRAILVVLVSIFACLLCANLILIARTLSPYGLCRRDLHQDYLQALAVRDGVDPFLNLDELARKYSPECDNRFFPHPSPHTLAQLMLSLPLSHLGGWWFAVVWMGGALGALAFVFVRLRSVFPLLREKWRAPLLFTAAFLSQPVSDDLRLGQIALIILALLAEALFRLHRGQGVVAGMFIGLAVVLKPIGWFLIPVLLLRRHISGLAAALTVGVAHIVYVSYWGFEVVVRYYTEVSKGAIEEWSGQLGNISISGVAERIIRGGAVKVIVGEPLPEGSLDLFPVFAIVAVSLVLATYRAVRAPDVFQAFMRALVFSPFFLPITWDHYLSVYILVLLWMLDRARGAGRRLTGEMVALLAVAFVLLSGVYGYLIDLVVALDYRDDRVVASAQAILVLLVVSVLGGFGDRGLLPRVQSRGLKGS